LDAPLFFGGGDEFGRLTLAGQDFSVAVKNSGKSKDTLGRLTAQDCATGYGER